VGQGAGTSLLMSPVTSSGMALVMLLAMLLAM
jgi:hypothetical protein